MITNKEILEAEAIHDEMEYYLQETVGDHIEGLVSAIKYKFRIGREFNNIIEDWQTGYSELGSIAGRLFVKQSKIYKKSKKKKGGEFYQAVYLFKEIEDETGVILQTTKDYVDYMVGQFAKKCKEVENV